MKLSPEIFNYSERSYSESQEHSFELDSLLGLKVLDIENQLVEKAKAKFPAGNLKSWGKSMHQGAQSWVGLSPEQLQTTYDELIEIVKTLNPRPGESWLDLGAGYSRLGFVLEAYCENVKFIGYEVVKERVDEANRVFHIHEMDLSKAVCQDLSDENFKLPFADTYFLYDYGNMEDIKITLNQISDIANNTNICLVARGRVRDFIHYHHPWLTVKTPIKKETYNIYFS